MDEELLVKVKVIRHKGQSSLIEFYYENENIGRVFVPSEVIFEERGLSLVSLKDIEMGIPYGVPFEEGLPGTFTIKAEQIVQELRKAGIWTVEDYEKSSGQVRAIILPVSRNILADLNSIVRETKRRRIQ